MESIYASEPTPDDKPVMESGMESTVDDKATTPPKYLVDVVAMANGLCDTERTPTGKSRRSQSRTCCRNRQSRQTNRYLAHDDVHCSEHPSLSESNSTVPDELQPCGTVARREPEAKGPDSADPVCNWPFDDIDAAAGGAAPKFTKALFDIYRCREERRFGLSVSSTAILERLAAASQASEISPAAASPQL
jgi:hypothetical protein